MLQIYFVANDIVLPVAE